MAHTTVVAHKNYENLNAYNEHIPANSLQPGAKLHQVQAVLDHDSVRPAFENEKFFLKGWPKQLNKLLPAEDFIKSQSKKPVHFKDLSCPVSSCTVQFHCQGDLTAIFVEAMLHALENAPADSCKFVPDLQRRVSANTLNLLC